jgi:hypothetical protein
MSLRVLREEQMHWMDYQWEFAASAQTPMRVMIGVCKSRSTALSHADAEE